MANVGLQFQASAGDADPQSRPLLLLGQLHHLHRVPWSHVRGKLQPRVTEELWQAALSTLNPNPTDSCPLYLNYATVAALPSRVSRHNSPSAAHFVTRLVRTCLPPGTHRCILMVCERSDAFASACALARAFPLFTHRSGASRRTEKKTVTVEFFLVGQDNGPVEVSTLQCLTNATEGVRLAARIVDTPCNEMNTDTFLEEIKKVGKDLGITPTIIRDEELKTRGFGGIYGVGKAALHPPALAVLSHTPEGATQTIAWVGKGIVYDTGGLSIKGKTTMPGMKRDCGGAAAVLGAFRAAIKQGFKDNLHAVFCLAENSVGPNATRPDDIHLLYSGKTVEINNTDAEGRLVLADGVSYACKDLGADIILDIATLTGAQGIATGKYHAAVLTNSAEWEAACVKAGTRCGDLVHPLVYCPELHFSEFTSAVADMKNSVADRDNSPSSCAGLFIASHIGFDWPGVWVHLDIAAPVHAVSPGSPGVSSPRLPPTPPPAHTARRPGHSHPLVHPEPLSVSGLSSSAAFLCGGSHCLWPDLGQPCPWSLVSSSPEIEWLLRTALLLGWRPRAFGSPFIPPKKTPGVGARGQRAIPPPDSVLSVAGWQEGGPRAERGVDALALAREPLPARVGLPRGSGSAWRRVSSLPFAHRGSVPRASAWLSCWHSSAGPLRTLC
uniref:Probable aminopeptidase NPEPL1 n=1 Tax=Panthera leo TaxID=9689 RepID=A0A8C8XES3_PANLE